MSLDLYDYKRKELRRSEQERNAKEKGQVMALQRVDWFEILDDKQCTFKLEKSEEETSETERSKLSEESKKEATQKPKDTYDTQL